MDQIKAPCSVCVAKTYQHVLHLAKSRDDQEQVALIECCGCGKISMRKQINAGRLPIVSYYPSPTSRRRPKWIWGLAWGIDGEENVDKLGDLLQEIYEAMDGGQLRLAAMGVRSLLEQVMVAKVGDQGTFSKNLS